MSMEDLSKRSSQCQVFVLSNIILTSIFRKVAGMLFDSIIHLQIFAHIPLTELYMPANVLQDFEIMIQVVSFDYIQPFDYIPAEFLATDAISPQFDWVGYGSQNFLDNMGTIWCFSLI